MWTLSSLQMHPHPMVICDEDATMELKVKTVKVGQPPSCVAIADARPVLQEYREGGQ
jgi:glucosamine-6-phosphate deaminase